MPALPVPITAIQGAVHDVMCALHGTKTPAATWKELSETALWRELVACILGSRVRFSTAYAAVEQLANADLLSPRQYCDDFNTFERKIIRVLSESDDPHPFSRVKGSQIRSAAEHLYASGGTLHAFLENACDARDARRCLASTVAGLGPKQASLFLRNVGFANELAVLDVHVLTYMNWLGLTDTPLASIKSLCEYEAVEDAFVRHSRAVGHSPDHFDLAVWVVVRTAKKEFG